MRGKVVLLIIILIITVEYVQAGPKVPPKTAIEGIISAVAPEVVGSNEVTFMLKGRKTVFSVDKTVCPEANFIVIDSKVKISFEENEKKKIVYCETFEIVKMIDVEGN